MLCDILQRALNCDGIAKVYSIPIILGVQIARSGGAIKLKVVPKPDSSVDTDSPEFLQYRLNQAMWNGF